MGGDVVCDIQTDKAVMAMEASEEGVLAKHLIEENTTVKVNTLIALLAEDSTCAGVPIHPPSTDGTSSSPSSVPVQHQSSRCVRLRTQGQPYQN